MMQGLIAGLGAGAAKTALHRLFRNLGVASKTNLNENAIQAGRRAARERAAERNVRAVTKGTGQVVE